MILTRIQIYLLGVAVIGAALMGIYTAGGWAALRKAEAKRDKRLITVYKLAQEVSDDVKSETDDALIDRASRWLRSD